MSDEYLKSDAEKAEDLKAWWREHGTSIIGGVALAVAILFGYDYWKNQQRQNTEQASELFDVITQDPSGIVPDDKLKEMQDKYAKTAYASFTTLDDARGYAEVGDYERAASSLQWVLDNTNQEPLKDIARIRLARVRLAQGKLDDALTLTNAVTPVAYDGLKEELRGDIYVARNQPDQAKAAYDKAIASNKGGNNELLRLKRDNLGS